MKRTLLLVLLASMPLCATAWALDLPERWAVKNDPEQPVIYSVAPLPLGEGQQKGFLVPTKTALTLIGPKGETVWRCDLPQAPAGPPALADINGDGAVEILQPLDASILCVGRDGKALWSVAAASGVNDGIVVADVTGDATPEFLAGDGDGGVTCWRGKERLWHLLLDNATRPAGSDPYTSRMTYAGDYHRNRDVSGALAVGDVDGDGKREIIVVTEPGYLWCLTGEGQAKWRFSFRPAFVKGAPVVADLEGDGRAEVITGANDHFLYVIDGAGRLKWKREMAWAVSPDPAVADLDGDGKREIVCGDGRGDFHCFAGDGTLRWKHAFKPEKNYWNSRPDFAAAPLIADIDACGRPEIVFGMKSRANLYVMAGDGTFKFSGELERGDPKYLLVSGLQGTALLEDLDGDGLRELVLPYACTEIQCRETKAAASVAPAWAGPRADWQMTGCALSGPTASPEAVAAATKATATITAPQVTRWPTGESLLPVKVEWEGEGDLVVVTEMGAFDGAVERRIDHVLGKPEEFEVPLSPEVNKAYPYECRVVALGSGAVLARAEGVAEVLGEPQEYAAAKRKARIAALGERYAERMAGGRLLLWADNPWAQHRERDFLPSDDASAAEVAEQAYQGEYVSAAINITNLGARTTAVRCTLAPWPPLGIVTRARDEDSLGVPAAPVEPKEFPPAAQLSGHIQLREATFAARRDGGNPMDALPLLPESGVIEIPAGETRQLWLTLDAVGLGAGAYGAAAKVTELDEVGLRHEIPVRLEVLDLALPKPSPLHFCTWAYLETSAFKNQIPQALADLVAHGNNVFPIGAGPVGKYDDTGAIVEADWSALDQMVARYAPYGMILLQGYNSIAYAGQGDPPPGAQERAFANWVRALGERMSSLGVSYDQWAIYVVDEPGLNSYWGIDYLMKVARAIKEADPRVQTYTDPINDMQPVELRLAAPYVDVWCPEQDSYYRLWGETANMWAAERLEIMKTDSTQVWTYECFPGAKHLDPLGYYRHQAWLAWMCGLNGMGFWTYSTAPTTMWEPMQGEYVMAYPGRDGPIPSKRWEACRDGVEDYGALWLLREELRKAEGAGVTGPALEEAREILENAATDVVEKRAAVEVINAWRARIAEATLALRDRGG